MSAARSCLLGACLSALAFARPGAGAEDEGAKAHEATLKSAGVKSDGESLLAYLRRRTPSEALQAKLTALVRRLGDEEFEQREKASEALVRAGRRAVPFLRPAVGDADPERARRARRCLAAIGPSKETGVTLAVLALVERKRPAGAAGVLLDYLPFADEEGVGQEVFQALLGVGTRGGKPEPALVKALKDPKPVRRAAAGWVLGRSKEKGVRDRVAPLLADADALVRWKSAEALLLARDRRAVPALVDLLADGPEDLAGQAEGLLALLAGEKAPGVALGPGEGERKKARDAWARWWRANEKMDLGKLDLGNRVLGLRLVVALNGYGGRGAVWEFGSDHKPRWQVRDVGGPFDARVLPGGRVLVGEYDGRRVTERDLKGKVLWEYRAKNGVLEVQRLPNGNTLVVTNHEIEEVTRGGKVVFTHSDPGANLFTGQRLPNGNVLYGLYTGELVEIDRAKKEVRRVSIPRPNWGLINVVVLPGGKYLLPDSRNNRVVEVDASGKVTWQVTVTMPTCVAVLPGGNFLVGSHRTNTVCEVDRKGKVLWSERCEGQVFRVRVR